MVQREDSRQEGEDNPQGALMRKLLLAIVVVLLPAIAQGEDWSKVLKQLRTHQVVQILTSQTFCTGVIIKPRVFLTASHCFKDTDGRDVLVLNHFGIQTNGRVTKIDRVIDLALVESDAQGLEPIEFAAGLPDPGEPVLAVGFTRVDYPVLEFTSAYVVMTGNHVEITSPLKHGFSGGPLVNLKGELVGIDVTTADESARAVSVTRVQKFLIRAAEGQYEF